MLKDVVRQKKTMQLHTVNKKQRKAANMIKLPKKYNMNESDIMLSIMIASIFES